LVFAGKIYVVGGENDVIQRNSAEMYDPEFNQWTLISRMRSARCRHSVVAFDGCVYAIGKYLRLFE
jgi:kelch-like protein 17 (actinfilin)